MNVTAITFDVDWAPDWCIEMCSALCKQYDSSATFFVTHRSDILDDLRKCFELGLHPNLLPGSTQGSNPREVLDFCLELVPEAKSMRTHSLFHSSPFYEFLIREYPMIQTDVSLYLQLHENLNPTNLCFNKSEGCLLRLPYAWEDDLCTSTPGYDWAFLGGSGLKIYGFHPIHVALNSSSLDKYNEFKRSLGPVPLHKVTKAQLAPFQNHGFGVRNFLEKLLKLRGNKSLTIAGIAEQHLQRGCV